jgi:hypothetical protein
MVERTRANAMVLNTDLNDWNWRAVLERFDAESGAEFVKMNS